MSVNNQEAITMSLLNEELFDGIIKANKLSPESTPFRITSFEIKLALEDGDNFLSKIYRIKIQITTDESKTTSDLSFIAKRLGSDYNFDAIADGLNVYPKEVEVFQKILPEFEKIWRDVGENVVFGAKLYKVIEEPERIFIFEDLCQTNYLMANRLEGFGLNEIYSVMEKLAKFHAASAVYYKRNGEFGELFKCGMASKDLEPIMTPYYNLFMQSFIDVMEEMEFAKDYIESLRKWNGHLYRINLRLVDEFDPDEFYVLNHGDLWINNIMMLKDSGDQAVDTKMIDFQIGFYGSPVFDILYFLMMSARPEILVSKFDDIIQHYHRELSRSLIKLSYDKIPTLKTLHLTILKNSIFASMLMVEGIPTVKVNKKTDGIDLKLVQEKEEIRRGLFRVPRYIKCIEKLLPFLGKRGMLDAE